MIDLFACPACGEPAADSRGPPKGGPQRRRATYFDPCRRVRVRPCVYQPSANPGRARAILPNKHYHVFADQAPDPACDRLLATKRRGDRLNHALVVPGGKYLDVGCGLGMMVAGMARLDMEAEGIDPGQAAVERARSLGLNVGWMLHDAHFPSTQGSTALACTMCSNTHLTQLACWRIPPGILNPNGEIVVGVPNFGSLVRALVGSTWSRYDLPRHLHHFCTSSIKNVAARAGLTVVAMDTDHSPSMSNSNWPLG